MIERESKIMTTTEIMKTIPTDSETVDQGMMLNKVMGFLSGYIDSLPDDNSKIIIENLERISEECKRD